MITLHRSGALSFNTLGIGPMNDFISGVVVEELNGMYELTMEYPFNGTRYKELKLRQIIYAKPNPYSSPQPFRIYSISKPINRKVVVNASHISYDLSGYPVNEFTAKSPSEAMNKLKSNAVSTHPFSFNSTSKATGEIKIEEPKSSRAVMGSHILSAFEGEFRYDTFMVYHEEKRGSKRGVEIRYGKNMLDMKQEENISNVFTAVYPYWIGQEADTDKKVLVKLPEKLVKVEGDFDFERILPLDLTEKFNTKPSPEDLKKATETYIKKNKVGIPEVSLEVSFVQLSKGATKDPFKVSDQVELGDTIDVYFNDLGISSTARCIKTTYNLATDKYDSIELGQSKSNLATSIIDNRNDVFDRIEQNKVHYDSELGNVKIDIATIDKALIEKASITWVEANYAHITNGVIDNAQIGNASIGTAQIKDANITVAKIQDAFIDNLVASQGKFQSAHIGVLTANNINADTITAEHISSKVIEAINMNVSGKISADRIDASSIKVDNIDAGSIKTGTLNAARIGAGTIDTTKLTITDFTNIATYFQNKNDADMKYTLRYRDHYMCQYMSAGDFSDDTEFYVEMECKTASASVTKDLNVGVYVQNMDGEWTYNTQRLSTANESRDWVKRSISIKGMYKGTPDIFYLSIQIPQSSSDQNPDIWEVKRVVARRKNNGKLIVDGTIETKHLKTGSITTDKIDANAITAKLITAEVIKAINISSEQIDAKNINTTNLKVEGSLIAGDISADRIKANVIAAINTFAGNAKIKQAQIETILVGNANIVDLDASKIKTGTLSADRIDTKNLLVESANITGTISATKINGGVLDASSMTVRNLKADSITAGSLTIDGDNLLRNSTWSKDTSHWTLESAWSRSSELKYNNACTLGINRSGITQRTRQYIETSDRILVDSVGSSYVYSIYVMSPNVEAIDDMPPEMEISFYSPSAYLGKKANIQIKPSTNGVWQRFVVTGKVPETATRMTVSVMMFKNGALNVALPMLQRGTIASEFKMHTDEQISNGSIDNDKLGSEAVTSSKLNLKELFVGDSAFIKQLNAVEIDATQITTGLIRGERIDINGLVSFEALDTKLQPLFDVSGNKTYINGGMVATNTIKADSIDLLSGLSVRGPDNTITFSIAKDGQVDVNALLQSGNFDDNKKTGYRISPDGKAILNEATVRGNVILPNAGITNDYDMSQDSGRNYWMNSGTPVSKSSFKGVNNETFGTETIVIPPSAKAGDKYTISFDITYTNLAPKSPLNEGEIPKVSFQGSGDVTGWNNGALDGYPLSIDFNNPNPITQRVVINRSFKKEAITNTKWFSTLRLNYIKSGVITISNMKLELGTVENPIWMPAPEDNFNPVRMWAGTNYELKDSAPFRVLQNGDFYASNAILSGILYGRLDSGFVNVNERDITLVDDTSIPSKEYMRINPDAASFNMDLIVKDDSSNVMYVSKSARTVDINGVLRVIGNNLDLVTSKSDGLTFMDHYSSGLHQVRYYTSDIYKGSMVFNSQGNQGKVGDFSFIRKHSEEPVKVHVGGYLSVNNAINSIRSEIEIRSESDGWGFYGI